MSERWEGRLLYGLFSGPIRQDNAALRQDDGSLLSMDAILAQFEGKRISITITEEQDDAIERGPVYQQHTKFSHHRGRGD